MPRVKLMIIIIIMRKHDVPTPSYASKSPEAVECNLGGPRDG